MYTFNHLVVDSCNDSCSYPHADDIDTIKVLVEEQGLDQCRQEEQDGVEVAVPVGLSLILSELYHQPVHV